MPEMKLNPKIVWGLAWAGLALVIAVPSADMMTAGFGAGGKKAILTSDIETDTPAPAKPAAAPAATSTGSRAPVLTPTKATELTTTRTANGVIITPAGGTLPTPADATALPPPTQVASVETPAPATKIVPRPLESWLRPVSQPAPAATAAPAPVVTTAPAAPAQQPALVIDEPQTAAIPLPPDPIVDDTQNWEEESLRDFLQRRGILEGGTSSRATVTQTNTSRTYDPDGFYLDEGPNTAPPMSAEERFWMLFEQDPDSFTVF